MSVPVWVRPRGEMGEIIAPDVRSGRPSVGDARIGCGIFITTEFCRARLIAMPAFEIEAYAPWVCGVIRTTDILSARRALAGTLSARDADSLDLLLGALHLGQLLAQLLLARHVVGADELGDLALVGGREGAEGGLHLLADPLHEHELHRRVPVDHVAHAQQAVLDLLRLEARDELGVATRALAVEHDGLGVVVAQQRPVRRRAIVAHLLHAPVRRGGPRADAI